MKSDAVYEYLKQFIDQNRFSDTNRLPSEPYLTTRLHVCRETVRRAIKRLSDEGLVYSVRGGGTYFDKAKVLSFFENEGGKHKHLALVVQGQDHNANSLLIQAVKEGIQDKNVDVRLFFTDNKIANERKCLEACKTGFDGIIVDGVKASIHNPNLDVYAALYARGIPFIFYNNYYAGTDYPRVIIDDEKCADALVKELVDNGHKYIAGVFFYDNYQGIKKYQGYAHALLKYGALFDDSYTKFFISDNIAYDTKLFQRELWRFLKGIPKCTAIVCCNIMIYKNLKETILAHALSINKDYSLVVLDYSDENYEEESITCSLHPGSEMGTLIVNRIIQMMKDPQYKKKDFSCVLAPRIYYGKSIQDIRTT